MSHPTRILLRYIIIFLTSVSIIYALVIGSSFYLFSRHSESDILGLKILSWDYLVGRRLALRHIESMVRVKKVNGYPRFQEYKYLKILGVKGMYRNEIIKIIGPPERTYRNIDGWSIMGAIDNHDQWAGTWLHVEYDQAEKVNEVNEWAGFPLDKSYFKED